MKHPWKLLGVCGMDTAGLLICDPCYVIPSGHQPPGQQQLEVHDYNAWVSCTKEYLPIAYRRGHEGAGLIVHSPHGDGSVEVYGRVDKEGRIHAVYFSFDSEKPK